MIFDKILILFILFLKNFIHMQVRYFNKRPIYRQVRKSLFQEVGSQKIFTLNVKKFAYSKSYFSFNSLYYCDQATWSYFKIMSIVISYIDTTSLNHYNVSYTEKNVFCKYLKNTYIEKRVKFF